MESIYNDLIEKHVKSSVNNDRYLTDPVYREEIKKRAKEWNENNAERKKQNDANYAKKHPVEVAEKQRRYRQNKKAKANVGN